MDRQRGRGRHHLMEEVLEGAGQHGAGQQSAEQQGELAAASGGVAPGTEPAIAEADASKARGAGLAVRLRHWARAHAFTLAGTPVVGISLFVLYLHQARTQPLNSDGAGNALQAWDMLHGNLLLSHWTLSDVSFYLTELPEYLLIELVHGVTGDVVHIAAAFSYTLAVLLAAWLARGRARGLEAYVRVLIVFAVMVAPGLALGTVVTLSSPDHFGTTVPLLVIFIALDRLPRRGYTPVIMFVLLLWAEVSDSTAIFVGGGAVAVIAVMRLWRRDGERGHEAAMLAASVLSIVLAIELPKVIQNLGGYRVHPPAMTFNGALSMSDAFWRAVKDYLDLFAADFFGLPVTTPSASGGQGVPFDTVVTLLHLVGAGLVACALVLTVRRLPRSGDRVAKLIAVGLLINLGAFLFSSQVLNGPREIAAVLPLGAVLAGRVVGPRLTDRRAVALLSALTVLFAGVLVQHATLQRIPAVGHSAGVWLQQNGYTYGLGAYWNSHSITVDTRNAVHVLPVDTGQNGIEQYLWESKSTWYDPAQHYANFLVIDTGNPIAASYASERQALAQFGPPIRTVSLPGQT
ncbi:MAG: hypothetical protein ACRDSS_13235, partial [Actinocrinis sp.]